MQVVHNIQTDSSRECPFELPVYPEMRSKKTLIG